MDEVVVCLEVYDEGIVDDGIILLEVEDKGLNNTPEGIAGEHLATVVAELRGKVDDRSTSVEGEFL